MQPTDRSFAGARGMALVSGALVLLLLVFALLAPALTTGARAVDAPFAARIAATPTDDLLFGPADASPLTPALGVSRRLDRVAWDDTVFGQRLHALVLHAANSILVLLVLRGAIRRTAPSLGAAALFALNPLAAVAVLWLGGRAAMLATGFCLLAIAALAWHRRRPGLLRGACWLAAFLLALLAHPGAAILPAVLLAYEILHQPRGSWRPALRDLWPALVLSVLALVAHARAAGLPSLPTSPWSWCALAYPLAAVVPGAVALDAQALSRAARRALLAITLLLLAASAVGTHLAVRAWRSDDLLLARVLRLQPRYEPARVWLAVQSRARGRPADAEPLAAALGPHREAWAAAFVTAAGQKARAGDDLAADLLLDHAATLAPGRADVRRRRGDAARKIGQDGVAFSNYVAALKVDAHDAEALSGLGEVLMARGQRADARDLFQQAVAEKADHTNALLGWARCEGEAGLTAEASALYDRVLALDPLHADAARERAARGTGKSP